MQTGPFMYLKVTYRTGFCYITPIYPKIVAYLFCIILFITYLCTIIINISRL